MLRKFLPWFLPLWGIAIVAFAYGYFAHANRIFPYRQIEDARDVFLEYKDKLEGKLPRYHVHAGGRPPVIIHRPGEMAPGLTLISGVGENEQLVAKLIDSHGKIAHQWDIDWFHYWPDNVAHIPAEDLPKSRPGTHLHGVVLSPNGDLTFNFENLGMIQLDVCGHTRWRLPRGTNHSLARDESGNFWTQERLMRQAALKSLPNFKPPFNDVIILKISPDGQVVKEIPFLEMLQKNGYQGLLYVRAHDNKTQDGRFSEVEVTGDNFHVNDVEIFPSTIKSDFFKPGDIMVSPRNINAIVVFDPETQIVKQVVVGRFLRQHDPYFIDGSTISVFDNNNITTDPKHASSRIVEYSFKTGATRVLFEGNSRHPFFTDVMGKHQHLPTGGMLLVESRNGRVLEVNADGEVVWEFNNGIAPGLIGLVDDAERIPPDIMSPEKLAQLAMTCES